MLQQPTWPVFKMHGRFLLARVAGLLSDVHVTAVFTSIAQQTKKEGNNSL